MEQQTYKDFLGENTERSTAEEIWVHDPWYLHEESRLPPFYNMREAERPTASFALVASVQEEQQPQSDFHYNHSSMYWSDREEEASGSSVIVPIFMIRADDYITDDDQEAHDRVVLLAKKYASKNVNLNKEDNARLEMINQKMDLTFPRYSSEDWELLDEAKALINKLTNISGAKI